MASSCDECTEWPGRLLYEELVGCSRSLCGGGRGGGGGDKGQGKENKAPWSYWAASHLPTVHSEKMEGKKCSQEVVHVGVAGNHACKLSERVEHAKLRANGLEEARACVEMKYFLPL